MQPHIKFASDLGFIVARAKFAAENPQIEKKKGIWSRLPSQYKALLLGLGGAGLGAGGMAAYQNVSPEMLTSLGLGGGQVAPPAGDVPPSSMERVPSDQVEAPPESMPHVPNPAASLPNVVLPR